MSKNIYIINTGGTFNKQYIQVEGQLQVEKDNKFIETILNDVYKSNKKPEITGIIFKDSIEIKKDDRKELVKLINTRKEKNIIIVHGTDTMNKTAKYLKAKIKNKNIVLTGSMQPFTLSKIEPTANLMMSVGFLSTKTKNNIYICMNGLVKKYNKIQKNYKIAVFQGIK